MPSKRRGASQPTRRSLGIDLFGGNTTPTPKTEFRIFTKGINASTQGEFLFDEQAALAVMDRVREHGVDLTIDYDHHTLRTDSGAMAKSAGWWTPEVRNGELWATNVRWTPPALELLGNREYRYFSPLFDVEPKSGRIKTIINCALTNTPSLFGIEPLVAASATAHDKEPDMDPELKKALERVAELEKENGTLKAAAGTLVALSTAAGLPGSATTDDVRTTLVALSSMKADVLKVTGQATVPAALGTIEGWKSEAADSARLKATMETERLEALSKELNGILDQAGKDGKIAPADRPEWERGALAFGQGKPSKDGVTWLSARVNAMKATVDTGGGGDGKGKDGGTKPPPGAVALSSSEKFVAQRLGIPEKEWQEREQRRLGGGA